MRNHPGARAAALVALVVVALTGCAASPRLPSGFPPSVPVLAGRVLATERSEYTWHVWVASAHPAAGYDEARRALLAKGYRETADTRSSAGSDGQFCDPDWCVGVTGYHDPQHGDSVMYAVARTSGMGPPSPL